MIADGFFFLRPYWWLLVIPVAILILALLRRSKRGDSGAWSELVDAHLLQHLTVQKTPSITSRWYLIALAVSLLAAITAMAGPTWQKNEVPSFKSQDPVVILLSLSQAMNATDLSPSRLVRASHKIRDILNRSKGGDIGFIVYADRPFVAAPLTSDAKVIKEMLPELSPDLIPVSGDRLDYAITQATDLLAQTKARRGNIIVLSNDAGTEPEASLAAAKQAAAMGFQVSVLGTGTKAGATLRTAGGKEIRDGKNQPIVTTLAEPELAALASVGGGQFVRLSPDNSDIDQLLPVANGPVPLATKPATNLHADTWNDMGYWLLIVPVLFAPLAFRRGMVMLLPLTFALVSLPHAQNAGAVELANLWQTPDQQAAGVFKQGEYTAAADTFENPQWKASALYKSGQYDKAAKLYENAGTSYGSYNLGNSLAHSGNFAKAIAAYDQALKDNPEDADAKFNRDLVAKLLEQQKPAEKNQQPEENPQEAQKQSNDDQQQSAGKGPQQDHQDPTASHQQQAGNQEQPDNQQQGDQQDQPNDKPGDHSSTAMQQQQGQQQQSEAKGDQPLTADQNANAEQKGGSQAKPASEDDNSADNLATANPEDSQSDSKNAFRKAMDALLQGNGEAPESDEKPDQTKTATDDNGGISENAGISEAEQTREQQLRAVPDDSSGLLRARIRQYYRQLQDYRQLQGVQQNG